MTTDETASRKEMAEERQAKATVAVVADLGGMFAFGLMERLPELSAHQESVERAVDALYRLADTANKKQAADALVALELALQRQRGAIARETVHAVLAGLDGYINSGEVANVAANART
jgi:adenosine deaminase